MNTQDRRVSQRRSESDGAVQKSLNLSAVSTLEMDVFDRCEVDSIEQISIGMSELRQFTALESKHGTRQIRCADQRRDDASDSVRAPRARVARSD